MSSKKSKYKAVTTTPVNNKKGSSLSQYKFYVNNQQMDFPKFKQTVESFFYHLDQRVQTYKDVLRVYQSSCIEAFRDACKILKRYNDSYLPVGDGECPVARIVSVKFNMEQESVATLTLADLGRMFEFNESTRIITKRYTTSEYGEIKEDRTEEVRDAAIMETQLKGLEYDARKRRVTKDWKREVITKSWIPTGQEYDLSNDLPIVLRYEGDAIMEPVHVTDLRIQLTHKKDGSVYTLFYPLPASTRFVRHFTSSDLAMRIMAFMKNNISAKEFFNTCVMDDTVKDTLAPYFTEDVHMSIFCTGTLNVVTEKINIQSSIAYNTITEEFEQNIELKVDGFKTDASIAVADKDASYATIQDILKEVEVDPLGVINN